MADISITAASVLPGSNAIIEHRYALEAVTAGQVGYLDPATKRVGKADSNSATEAVRKARCIFLNGAAAGQPVACQTGGDITAGGTLVAGVAYYLSDTPGGICPVADVGSGEYATLLGMSKSTTVLTINIQAPGVAL